jgi:hypothetical protein
MKIVVPPYPQSEFGISDVILARSVRVIEVKKEPITVDSSDIPALKMLERAKIKVPNKVELTQRQSDPFTFGNLEISPNPSSTYNTNEELVFFYQIYNPVLDPAQRSASILIEHQVWQGDKLIAVIDKPQEAHILAEQTSAAINSGARFTLRDFASGQYVLLIRARDVHSNKLIEKKANFTVK